MSCHKVLWKHNILWIKRKRLAQNLCQALGFGVQFSTSRFKNKDASVIQPKRLCFVCGKSISAVFQHTGISSVISEIKGSPPLLLRNLLDSASITE